MKRKIHIFGASGSGTTTIASAVSEKLGYKHFDTDNLSSRLQAMIPGYYKVISAIIED